jgi:hypothetical protein
MSQQSGYRVDYKRSLFFGCEPEILPKSAAGQFGAIIHQERIAEYKLNLDITLYKSNQFFQLCGIPKIVLVAQSDELSGAEPHRLLEICCRPQLL